MVTTKEAASKEAAATNIKADQVNHLGSIQERQEVVGEQKAIADVQEPRNEVPEAQKNGNNVQSHERISPTNRSIRIESPKYQGPQNALTNSPLRLATLNKPQEQAAQMKKTEENLSQSSIPNVDDNNNYLKTYEQNLDEEEEEKKFENPLTLQPNPPLRHQLDKPIGFEGASFLKQSPKLDTRIVLKNYQMPGQIVDNDEGRADENQIVTKRSQ